MFKKDFKIKTNVKVKKSEKNKLIERVCKQYLSEKLKLSELFNSDIFKLKIETSREHFLLYRNAVNPIFFEYYDRIYPTVYSMNYLYDTIPSFTTYEDTITFLSRGSDFMIPGIIVSRPVNDKSYGKFKKGDIVAINTNLNKVPFAVGVTLLDSYDMYLSGGQGKAVTIYHIEGDTLWQSGDKGSRRLVEWDCDLIDSSDDSNDEEQSEEPVEDVDIKSEEELSKEELVDNDAADNDSNEEEVVTVEKMNKLLEDCFLHAIRYSVKEKCFPMNFNTLYSNYILKYCPENEKIDMRKTSYKKFINFMKEKEKEGLVSICEIKEGVYCLDGVDKSHEKMRFTAFLKERQETSTDSSGSAYTFPQILDVYFVTNKVLPIMKLSGYRCSDTVNPQNLRQIIKDYVIQNELQKSNQVKLDPILASVVLKSKEYFEELSWKDLYERFQNQMTCGTILEFPNKTVTLKNVKCPKINLMSMKRHNKMITRVTGNEIFQIDNKSLSTLIQQQISCSCGVVADNTGVYAVQAQGDQKKRISKILTEVYKVPNKCIDIVERKK